MTETQTPAVRPMANARAEAHFVASGLPDALRPAVSQEAVYTMNCTNMRFSDAVHMACQGAKRGEWASPAARVLAAARA